MSEVLDNIKNIFLKQQHYIYIISFVGGGNLSTMIFFNYLHKLISNSQELPWIL